MRTEVSKVALVDRHESSLLLVESEVHLAHGAVAVLFDEDLRHIGALVLSAVAGHILAVDKHDHVGVLFDRAGIAKVGEARASTALLHCARKLRKRDHRHVELARHAFE